MQYNACIVVCFYVLPVGLVRGPRLGGLSAAWQHPAGGARKDDDRMQGENAAYAGPLRWGVLGAADIAVRRMLPALMASQSEALVAVASRNPQRARQVLGHVPDLKIYGDYESLLADPEIDAIYNPLPNALHAPWTIKALEAGKHVLCEKPMAVTAAEGTLMIEAAQAQRKLLMEAFMYRFHPQTVWALAQISAGLLGAVKLIRSSFSFDIYQPSRADDIRLQPQLAGGSLMDVGCYPVNFCRMIYGRPPVAVAARTAAHTPDAVEHTVAAVLDFGEGRFGLIDSSFAQPEYQIAEVVGELGTLVLYQPFLTSNEETQVVLTLKGEAPLPQHIPPDDPYRLEAEHFSSCVRAGTALAFGLDETLENLATIEAIYQSAGHRWPLNQTANETQ